MKKFEDMGRDPDTMEERAGYTELYNLAHAGAEKETLIYGGAWSNIPGKEGRRDNDYKGSTYEERI